MASKGPGKSARIDRYIVQPGDSLSLIAERLFCSASAWQQIHHLNQGRIPDLMKIQPGLVLRLDGVESRCPPGP
jgi:LysM repeat protein